MKYVFEVGHASGALKLTYDSRLNTLDGAGVPPNFIMGQRDGEELRINIVMGTACNYRCGYCCQADMKKEISLRSVWTPSSEACATTATGIFAMWTRRASCSGAGSLFCIST